MTPPPTPTMASEASAQLGESRRRHVLLFPLPYQGHINPMFRLAGVLHARGFAITIFHTHSNAPDPAQHPAYRFVPVPDGPALEDVTAQILALGESCVAAFEERLAAVLEECTRDAVAFLVADAHLLPIVKAATRLSVPTLTLRLNAASFLCFAAYPMLCEKGYLPAQESQREALVRELPPYRVRDLMCLDGDGLVVLREVLARAVAAVKASSGLVINTFDALERQELTKIRQDLAIPVFDVGPLHMFSPAAAQSESSSLLRQDRTCLGWLDAQPPDSVIYISFGSIACMTPAELIETAWGIAESGVPFLWVIRPGMVVDGSHEHQLLLLPEEFGSATRGRGMVVAWAPQVEVLRHPAVGGFWTHNGWNSTIESIADGVPMLCRPCFGDQMGNARYVEHVWRVGFELEGDLHRTSVEAAIRRLMKERDGDEMRSRASDLKKAAVECIAKDGSSSQAIHKLVTHMMSL